MKKTCLVLCLFGLIPFCSDKFKYSVDPISSNDSLIIIDVDLIQDVETKCLSDVFRCVKAVILEDTPESLIGTISKMSAINGFIILLDMNISKTVFVFDDKGNFIRKIGSIGEGPGEYLNVYDFAYNPENSNLMLLDTWSQKIITYELHTGKHTGTIRLRGDIDRFVRSYHIYYQDSTFYTDAYFDFPSPRNYLLRRFSDKGILQLRHLRADEYNRGWHNHLFVEKTVFYDFGVDEGLLFHQQFMDTIMMVKNKHIFPYAVLKSDKFITDKNIKKNNKNREDYLFVNDVYGMNVIWGISNIVLHKDYLYFRYFDGEYRVSQILHQKSTGVTSKVNLKNDVLYKEEVREPAYQSYLYADDKGLYTFIDIKDFELLITHARDGLLSLPSEQIEKIIKLNEDSNPLILYYEYKE